MRTLQVLLLSAFFALAAFVFGLAASPASAHRSHCHQAHTCPSDHATCRWRSPTTGIRWLCVHRLAEELNATFRKRIVYGGRVYFCKR
jgi:hypothetical protein